MRLMMVRSPVALVANLVRARLVCIESFIVVASVISVGLLALGID